VGRVGEDGDADGRHAAEYLLPAAVLGQRGERVQAPRPATAKRPFNLFDLPFKKSKPIQDCSS
jgi:hypothetical protein